MSNRYLLDVRRYRNRLGMTQQRFADECCLTRRAVVSIEREHKATFCTEERIRMFHPGAIIESKEPRCLGVGCDVRKNCLTYLIGNGRIEQYKPETCQQFKLFNRSA